MRYCACSLVYLSCCHIKPLCSLVYHLKVLFICLVVTLNHPVVLCITLNHIKPLCSLVYYIEPL
jgi:hypothetical protein